MLSQIAQYCKITQLHKLSQNFYKQSHNISVDEQNDKKKVVQQNLYVN